MSLQPLIAGDFVYRVQRSARRRTVSVEIRDAEVIVRAPPGVSERMLQQMVHRKRAWIAEKLTAQRRQLARIPEYSYLSGSAMPWLDETLTLVVGQGVTGGVHRRGTDLIVSLSRRSTRSSTEQARRLVKDWGIGSINHLFAPHPKYLT